MKVRTWLPVFASARFELEIDEEEWNKMTVEQKHLIFLGQCYPTGGLCCQCSDDISCDLDIDSGGLSEDPQDFVFEVEE
jgi:hypothetical protein